MQPVNDDDELRKLLLQWQAPAAPAGLEKRVLDAAQPSLVRRFLVWCAEGSIRVPVPAVICLSVIFLFLAVRALQPPKPPETSNFSQFQPVTDFNPRVIRSSYAPN